MSLSKYTVMFFRNGWNTSEIDLLHFNMYHSPSWPRKIGGIQTVWKYLEVIASHNNEKLKKSFIQLKK